MRRFGRRRGFIGSSLIAALAALLAAYAVYVSSFALFCVATFFTGMNGAFMQQYRFAASESVEPRYASRAVSFVLVGGIFAGILGPMLASRTKDLVSTHAYVGSFISLAFVYLLSAGLLLFFREVVMLQQAAGGVERPLRQIVSQPLFLVALLSGVVAYGVMSFTMTATPIQLNRVSGFTFDQTAFVIQSHVVAMFLPSLFTGFIMERLGLIRVMFIGVVILGLCAGLGIVSYHLLHYWGALVLLGIGWNFLYIGATVLLTRTYFPAERFKTQATNEFVIFGMQAIASFSAGTVIFSLGWVALNLICLPFLIVTLGALLFLRRRIADPRMQDELLAPSNAS